MILMISEGKVKEDYGLIVGIGIIAETNRPPFDLVESESELVSGAFTEYSSFSFALIFLGEYGAMITMSSLISSLKDLGHSFNVPTLKGEFPHHLVNENNLNFIGPLNNNPK
ncbi:hypothetical protein BB560_000023 [Smittium megazygosporum]|uniref:Uncharacterized protein n=1 Tax=Smittium megazygosporum TaxID=133381 RepID=A0A2T9ZLN0_9FUNG|nr:hypothetical protein BB560_000023 [Smittium megazygosporum]